MAFSPDGEWLASAGDLTVRLWSLSSPQTPARVIHRHGAGAGALGVTFSEDSQHLITCGSENPIRIWQTATGREDGPALEEHTAYVLTVATSRDGRLLASAASDGRIIVWDLASRRPLFEFADARSGILSVAFSPDGSRLASGGRDQTVRLWDLSTRRQAAMLRGHEGAVRSVAFAPAGDSLVSIGRGERPASGGSDGSRQFLRTWTAKVWDAAPAASQGARWAHDAAVVAIEFSPDGRWLASGDYHGIAKLWDVRSGRLEATLPGHTSQIELSFAPDSQLLATGDLDGIVRVWRPGEEAPIAVLTNSFGVRALDFSPDGRTLAVGGGALPQHPEPKGAIWLWDTHSFQRSRVVEVVQRSVRGLAFDPRGRYLAAGFDDGMIGLWSGSAFDFLRAWKAHSGTVWSLAFSPDGARLASGGADQSVVLCDLTKPDRTESVLRGHTHWVWSLAFSPDGRTLASTGQDGTPKLWSLATREVALTLKSAGGPIIAVAFSPNGNLLASGGADGEVRLWRAASFEETDAAVRTRAAPHP